MLNFRFYVATQNPLPDTVGHFWQMVVQCDVNLIVMLTESSGEVTNQFKSLLFIRYNYFLTVYFT